MTLCVCAQLLSHVSSAAHGLQPTRLSVHGISQSRILEWVAISYSRGSICLLHLLPWQADSLPLHHSIPRLWHYQAFSDLKSSVCAALLKLPMEQHSKDTKDGAAVTEKPSEHHQAAVPPGGRHADFRECRGSPCHREEAGRCADFRECRGSPCHREGAGRRADFRECRGSPCHREGAGRERTSPACAERDAESRKRKTTFFTFPLLLNCLLVSLWVQLLKWIII